jgi:membrane-associated HD superfamily phosphohydrolase
MRLLDTDLCFFAKGKAWPERGKEPYLLDIETFRTVTMLVREGVKSVFFICLSNPVLSKHLASGWLPWVLQPLLALSLVSTFLLFQYDLHMSHSEDSPYLQPLKNASIIGIALTLMGLLPGLVFPSMALLAPAFMMASIVFMLVQFGILIHEQYQQYTDASGQFKADHLSAIFQLSMAALTDGLNLALVVSVQFPANPATLPLAAAVIGLVALQVCWNLIPDAWRSALKEAISPSPEPSPLQDFKMC